MKLSKRIVGVVSFRARHRQGGIDNAIDAFAHRIVRRSVAKLVISRKRRTQRQRTEFVSAPPKTNCQQRSNTIRQLF